MMNTRKNIQLKRYLEAGNDTGVLFSSSFACGVLAIITSVILTSSFGLGRLTDSYFMAFSILLIFNKLFRQGTFRKVYVSLFVPLTQKGREDVLKKTVVNFQSIAIILFSLLAIVLILMAPWLVRLMAPGFDSFTAQHTVNMVRLLMLTIVYSALCAILISLYHSYHKFIFPAIVQIVPYLVSFLTALFFLKPFGIHSLIWAFLVGALLHLTLLYTRLPIKGVNFNLKSNSISPEIKKLGKLVFPFYISEVGIQALLWVQNILSSLLAPGTVSILVLARKLRSYFVEYILTPLPTVIYPSLIKKLKNRNALSDLTFKSVNISSFVIFPAIIWFIVLSYQLIRLIFQRGHFTSETANNLAGFLIVFSMNLVFETVSPILTKILFAVQKTGWINVVRFTERAIDVILSLLFFKYFGFLGLAWAVVVGAIVNFMLTCFYVNKIIKLRPVFFNRPFGKIMINVVFMFCLTLLANNFLSLHFNRAVHWQQVVQILSVISITGLAYVLAAHVMKIEELAIIFNVIKLKFQKPKVLQTP